MRNWQISNFNICISIKTRKVWYIYRRSDGKGKHMNYELKKVADNIIDAAIKAVLPDKAVIRALENKEFPGRVILVSVGKAAWQMANAASEYLGDRIDKGIVITKY